MLRRCELQALSQATSLPFTNNCLDILGGSARVNVAAISSHLLFSYFRYQSSAMTDTTELSTSEPPKFVKLVSSDGFEFIVQRTSACVSGAIKRMLDPKSKTVVCHMSVAAADELTDGFAESKTNVCIFETIKYDNRRYPCLFWLLTNLLVVSCSRRSASTSTTSKNTKTQRTFRKWTSLLSSAWSCSWRRII